MLRAKLVAVLGTTLLIATSCRVDSTKCPCSAPPPASSGGQGTARRPPCVPEPEALLDRAKLVPQQSDMLCWAAAGEMIMGYFGRPVSQCEQVRHRPGASTCACSNCPDSKLLGVGLCNNGGWPDFRAFHFRAERRVNSALTLDELKAEISCFKSPVAFSWQTGEGTGHMMVAYGYDSRFINVLDPSEPCEGRDRDITYYQYVHGESVDSSHWDDFYEIEPEGSP